MGGMPGKGGPMMGNPMMGMGQMPGKGGPMMGGAPMMGMNPQMMQMMQQKGQMPMMGKGGMPPAGARPPMPQQQMQQRPPMPQQMQQQPPQAGAPLNASALAAAPPAVQKQMIGEKFYPAIAKFQPEVAGKVTGMMLEMDNSELLMLLESESQLRGKVNEAMGVL